MAACASTLALSVCVQRLGGGWFALCWLAVHWVARLPPPPLGCHAPPSLHLHRSAHADEVDAVAAVTAYAKELEVMPTIQGSSELEADTGGWPGWLGVWLGCCGASRRSLRAWHHHLHCLALAPPWHPASVRPAVPSRARASLSDDVASSRDHSITSGLEGQRRTAGATTSASRRSQ